MTTWPRPATWSSRAATRRAALRDLLPGSRRSSRSSWSTTARATAPPTWRAAWAPGSSPEPAPGYGAAVHAGLLAATADLRRVHGRRRLVRPRPSCCRCSTTSLAAGPTSRSAGAARSRRASGPGTPGSATRWSLVAAPPDRAAPPTTSRRCGSCRRADLLALDVRDRRFGYPVELLQKATDAGLAGRRARRGLPPAGRGHPVEGVRLGAGHHADRPRLLAGALDDPVTAAGRRQGAGRRTGQDPARRRGRPRGGRRGRRGRAARHARRLRARRSAPGGATSRSPATSPTRSRRATSSRRASPGWTVTPAAGHGLAERLVARPPRRSGPGRSSRSAWTPRRSTRSTCTRGRRRRLDDARRRARPGRRRRLVGARPARPGRRAPRAARRPDVHADHVRRHPRARWSGPDWTSADARRAARRRHRRRTPTLVAADAPGTRVRPGLARGCGPMTDADVHRGLRAAPSRATRCHVVEVDGSTSRGSLPVHRLGPGRRRRRPRSCSTAASEPTLDIGCGPGRLSAQASRELGHVVLGIDVVPEAVAQTRRPRCDGAAPRRLRRAAGRGPLAHRAAGRRQHRHRRRPGRAAAPAARAARPARPGGRRARAARGRDSAPRGPC